MNNNFSDFGLSQEVMQAVAEVGYELATSIQAQSIPVILSGSDVIGHSQTGSGKTAAFGLPAIDAVDLKMNPGITQVLILCPTRELALQATQELQKFAKYKPSINIVPIYGGAQIDRQLQQLRRGCQIVIGTPGRVMDHMRRRTLKLADIKMVVLDEADEMLNMGFREDIETILTATPAERQTVLFSATMPKPILEITGLYQRNPIMVKIENKQMTVATIEQSFFEVARGKKNDALCLLLEYYQPKLSLVFCNTKKMVDELVAELSVRGYSAQGLHGDMKQSQRTQVMNCFKDGGFGILVATDVAARGIDVNDIDIVFNYDLPADDEYYVHRIGRTGRAGKEGKSFTLVQGAKQFSRVQEIVRYTKCRIERRNLPKLSEIKDVNTRKLEEQIKNAVTEKAGDKYSSAIEELAAQGFDAAQVAAALFSMCIKESSVTDDEVQDRHLPRSDRPSGSEQRKRFNAPRTPNAKTLKKFEGEDMEQVRISIGRRDKVAPNHILGAVAGESGLPGKIMGTIDIHSTYTTIDVPKKYKTLIVKSLNKAKIKGKEVTAK